MGCNASRDMSGNAAVERQNNGHLSVIISTQEGITQEEYRPSDGGMDATKLVPQSVLHVEHNRESSALQDGVASRRTVAFAREDSSQLADIQYYTELSDNRTSVATTATDFTARTRKVTVWETNTRPTDVLYVDLATEIGMPSVPTSPGRRRKSGHGNLASALNPTEDSELPTSVDH
eukprot:GEMP01070812.1.p1 GENE.GEMP01070812.1~~GEMP01070812.1.p1  ORF type:complete len:197 (+),score=32.15 GEMP01070812.1:61-591(+)